MTAREEQTHVTRQNGKQINDTVKGENVLLTLAADNDTNDILQSKNDGKDPFPRLQPFPNGIVDPADTVEHHNQHTQNDQYQQNDIEIFSGRCVGFKNNGVPFIFPRRRRCFV